MGGGVGLSAHGSLRVVTERSRVAMPETTIGFVPDVGGTYLLSRAPGLLGTHLALTGTAVGAADAQLCGWPTTTCRPGSCPMIADLSRLPAEEAVARRACPAPEGELAAAREWIDACYAAETVEEILERLLDCGVAAAEETAVTLQSKSPTALKVTLEAVRRARELDSLEEVLVQEFRVSCNALGMPDLVEGIRAQVIDKDRSPRWSPADLAAVTRADVERFFAPVEGEPSFGG